MNEENPSNVAHWFPAVQRSLYAERYPRTMLIGVGEDFDLLGMVVDPPGKTPAQFVDLIERVHNAILITGGYPSFIRTNLFSGKHGYWSADPTRSYVQKPACLIDEKADIGPSICRLVEGQHCAMMFTTDGFDTIVVRERVPVAPIMYAYGGLPIVPERRYRIKMNPVESPDDAIVYYPVESFCYWPLDAIMQGNPRSPLDATTPIDRESAELLYTYVSDVDTASDTVMGTMSRKVVAALGGGYWSVDWMQSANRTWKLIDMARGEESWWPDDPEPKTISDEDIVTMLLEDE